MSAYGDILDAIVAHLAASPERDPESPLRVVRRGTSGKSLAHFVNELEKHGSAIASPAALVRYGGADSNEGLAGNIEAKGLIQVACLTAGTGDADAEERLFEVIDFVRGEIHNRDDIDGLANPLLWAGDTELSPVIAVPPSIAAMVVRFTAPMWFAEQG